MAAPTQKEIDEAKAFLRTRLSAEQSMSYNLSEALYIASLKILEICKKYAVKPDMLNFTSNQRLIEEINKVISQLEDDLYSICEKLCEYANPDDRHYIVAFMTQMVYGMTLASRIAKHLGTWLDSLEKAIKAKAIFPSKMFKGEIKALVGSGLLDTLLRDTVGRVYMDEWRARHINATGFYSYRGSSYPCDECDEYTGYHPISEYRLPLHPHCCCFAVFVYD